VQNGKYGLARPRARSPGETRAAPTVSACANNRKNPRFNQTAGNEHAYFAQAQAQHAAVAIIFGRQVFDTNFIANWIDMKQKEYDALRLRPHPYEFAMYYEV
jgi:hypothetical protein